MAANPSAGTPSKYEEEPSATTGEQEQPDHHQKAHDDQGPIVVAPPKAPQSDVHLLLTPTDNQTVNLPRKGHVDINRYCTKLCRNFIAHGSCPFAQNCIFAHGEHQLRPLGSLLVQPGEEQSQPQHRHQHQLLFQGLPPPASADPSALTMMRVSVGGGGGGGSLLQQQQQQQHQSAPQQPVAVFPQSYYGGQFQQQQPILTPVSQSLQQQLLPSFSTTLQQPLSHPQQQMLVFPQQQQQVGLQHHFSPQHPEARMLPSLHPVMTGQSPQQQLTFPQPLAHLPLQPVLNPSVGPSQHAQGGGSAPMFVAMVSSQEQQQQQQASQLLVHNELPSQRPSAVLPLQQQQLPAALPSAQPNQFYVVN